MFIGIAVATVLVFVCAFIYAISKLNSEKSMYDLAERKSYGSSSVHGIYRSRNSMQMALQQGDMALLAEEVDNIHNDDTLKRVPEMPEEEEAEAIEMVSETCFNPQSAERVILRRFKKGAYD